MNWKLTPTEPTPEMIAECQGERENHPVLKYLTPGERSGPLLPLAFYRASISAAPDPLADAELVERVARWLAFHNGYGHTGYYTSFLSVAKDLIKVIQEGNG